MLFPLAVTSYYSTLIDYSLYLHVSVFQILCVFSFLIITEPMPLCIEYVWSYHVKLHWCNLLPRHFGACCQLPCAFLCFHPLTVFCSCFCMLIWHDFFATLCAALAIGWTSAWLVCVAAASTDASSLINDSFSVVWAIVQLVIFVIVWNYLLSFVTFYIAF